MNKSNKKIIFNLNILKGEREYPELQTVLFPLNQEKSTRVHIQVVVKMMATVFINISDFWPKRDLFKVTIIYSVYPSLLLILTAQLFLFSASS